VPVDLADPFGNTGQTDQGSQFRRCLPTAGRAHRTLPVNEEELQALGEDDGLAAKATGTGQGIRMVAQREVTHNGFDLSLVRRLGIRPDQDSGYLLDQDRHFYSKSPPENKKEPPPGAQTVGIGLSRKESLRRSLVKQQGR
jgi:hypothetical protein